MGAASRHFRCLGFKSSMLARSRGCASLSCTVPKPKDPATRQRHGTKQDVSMGKMLGGSKYQAVQTVQFRTRLSPVKRQQRDLSLDCRVSHCVWASACDFQRNHLLSHASLACMETCSTPLERPILDRYMRTGAPWRLRIARISRLTVKADCTRGEGNNKSQELRKKWLQALRYQLSPAINICV